MKKLCIGILKLAISGAILGYLFYVARSDQSFVDLWEQPKQWGLLGLALAVTSVAVITTFLRWYLLVNALGLRFAVRDAFRLGFLAYLFNFFSLGVVGGDLLKSVFVAREHPHKRTAAVASVIVDRAIGLFALLFVGSLGFLCVDLSQLAVRDPARLAEIQMFCRATLSVTGVAAVGFVLVLIPGFAEARFWDRLRRVPLVGGVLANLVGAVRVYSRRPGLLLLALLLSLGVHLLNTLAVFLIALGLPGAEPSLAAHFVIVPIAMVAGAVPLPGGLGALEYALDFLYRGISTVAVAPRQGFVIALGFRVIQILIASVGLVYYLLGRREVAELIREAEDTTDDEDAKHVRGPGLDKGPGLDEGSRLEARGSSVL